MPTVPATAPTAAPDETEAAPQTTVSFNLSDPAIADGLTDCEVGKPEELTITFTPTEVTDEMVTGTISAVSYAGTEETEEAPAEEEMPMNNGKKMPKALNIQSGY